MPPPITASTPATRAPGLCRLGSEPPNEATKRTVALTFDDGPDPVNTPQILAILREHHIHATFFVKGSAVRANPELVRQIVAEGHSLGNHTENHRQLTKLTAEQVRFELSAAQTAVNDALGYEYPLVQMRPPYGANNQTVREVVQSSGQCMVLWDVDSNDWRYKNNDELILSNVFDVEYSVYRKGGVVLFHDVHPQTVRVLDTVLDRLEHDGFTFTTTGEMLDAKYR